MSNLKKKINNVKNQTQAVMLLATLKELKNNVNELNYIIEKSNLKKTLEKDLKINSEKKETSIKI